MKVTIYTSGKKIIDDVKCNSIYLPGEKGDFQILENHVPIISALKQGEIILDTEKGKVEIKINYGYVQFAANNAHIVIQNTSLTEEELENIQLKAEKMKDTVMRKEETISSKEFENREESTRI